MFETTILKPTFIKFYSVVSIILIVLSSVSPMPNTLNMQAVIMSIQLIYQLC